MVKHKGQTISTVVFCEICNASGNHEKGMKRHKLHDHKVRNEVGSSDEEDTRVRRRYKYKFNPKPVSGYEEMPYEDIWYQCNFCDKQLKPRKTILRHIRLKHDPEVMPFGCRFCIERFETGDILNEHTERHHEHEEKPVPTTFFCDICGISGNSKVGMDHHKTDDHMLPFYSEPHEIKTVAIASAPILTVRKRQDDFFNPRAQSGSESLKYEDTWYVCSFCDKQLKPRRVMLRHMRLKHNPLLFPFACRFCIKRFETCDELETHESTHKFEKPSMLFCDYCDASGNHKKGMQVHIFNDHLKRLQKSNVKSDETTEKVHLNHASKVVKCPRCNERFRDRLTLRNHVMSFHDKLFRALNQNEIEQDLSCCACKKLFTSENELLIHVESHLDNFTEIKCVHCPVPIKSFEIFMKHVKYHMKAKTHQCGQCQKVFSFDGKFICHVNSHKRNHRAKISCEKCGSKFRNEKELEVHDKVKHNNETLFICPICAKSLGSATILDNHIKYVHSGDIEKKHECRICSLKFTHRSKLQRHEATHSVVRPHVCEVKNG